jgi:hypothetical protein
MISEPTPEEIERQMAVLRSVLEHDVKELASEARTLTDWRHHFQRHPWLFCGAAAALGFLVVPRARRVYSVVGSVERDGHQESLSEPVQLEQQPKRAGVVSDGLIKPLLKLALAAAARQSFAMVLDRVRTSTAREAEGGGQRNESFQRGES